MEKELQRLHSLYYLIKDEIASKLKEFEKAGEKEETAFKELIFCILTPQSKAEACWNAVENLFEKDVILKGSFEEIVNELKGVRFKFNKARYIMEARKFFNGILKKINGLESMEAREWLVRNVKGMGYKEASHFLRNIGKGYELAILDRHILNNLDFFEVINEVPSTLTKKRYIQIEGKMKEFAKRIGIPMAHLDFVFWYRQTGRIFK